MLDPLRLAPWSLVTGGDGTGRPAGKNQENERRPPGERYAHINAGHVPDFIRFGVKPHCYDEFKCYTPFHETSIQVQI